MCVPITQSVTARSVFVTLMPKKEEGDPNADPHCGGRELKRRPQPICSTCPVLKEAFRAAYKAFVTAYREAYAQFKEGVLATVFPPGGLPPVGWWGTSPAPA